MAQCLAPVLNSRREESSHGQPVAERRPSEKRSENLHLPHALGPPRGEGGRVLQGCVWSWGIVPHRGPGWSGGRPAVGGGSGILGGGRVPGAAHFGVYRHTFLLNLSEITLGPEPLERRAWGDLPGTPIK